MTGRARVRAELTGLLEHEGDGFRGIALRGAAGLGKSVLCDEVVRAAAGKGWTVLAARAAEPEAHLPYVTVGDLLQSAPRSLVAALPPPERRALEVALLRSEPEGSLGLRAVAAGLLTLVELLSREAPLLIAVDDAHWMDDPSAAALEFAARRLDGHPVRLLLTHEPARPPLEHAPSVSRLELGPLDAHELHVLLESRSGESISRRRLLELAQLSGGNPAVALELVRAGWRAGRRPPAAPAAIGEAFLARVRVLPAILRQELLVAALATEPAVPPVDADLLEVAVDAGIVAVDGNGRIAFSHPLLAWAVLHVAGDDEHRFAHLRLAKQASDPDQRAVHLARAAKGPDAALADQLERMAAAARRRGEPFRAAGLLAEARRLTSDDDAWGRRCAQEIEQLLAWNDHAEAWALAQDASSRLPAGPARAALLLGAAERRPDAAGLCLQALVEAAWDPDLLLRAYITAALQHLWAFDVAAAAENAGTAVELARETRDTRLAAKATAAAALVRSVGGIGLEEPATSLAEALSLTFAGDLDAARHKLTLLRSAAAGDGDEAAEAEARAVLGVLELRAGNWRRAQEQLEAAVRAADLGGDPVGRGVRRAWLAMLHACRGELETARRLAAEAAASSAATGARISLVLGLTVLAFVSSQGDDPAETLEHCERIRRLLPEGLPAPPWLELEREEIGALVALERLDQAELRLGELRARGGDTLRRRLAEAEAQALLSAARGDMTAAIETLEVALRETGSPGLAFERACALRLKSRFERRSKQKAAARVSLEQAAALFESLEAPARAEQVRAEIARLGLRRATEALTATEQRVAALAAEGRSNREIATTLFISRRTVETNVARVYRKLGVASRVELARSYATRPELGA